MLSLLAAAFLLVPLGRGLHSYKELAFVLVVGSPRCAEISAGAFFVSVSGAAAAPRARRAFMLI